MSQTSKNTVSRRAVARGMAWSVPVVAAASVAPAFASSPGEESTLPNGERYYGNAQAYATESAWDDGVPEDRCPAPGESTLLTLGGFIASPQFPERGGISIDHEPGAAPATATIDGPLQYVVAYPIEMFSSQALNYSFNNMFDVTTGGANWNGPETSVVTMTNPNGVTGEYVVVKFTLANSSNLTGETVDYGSGQFWPNTALQFRLKSGYQNPEYCKPTYGTTFRGGFYSGNFTGAEGDWTTPVNFDVNGGEYTGQLPIINGTGWYEYVRDQPNQ